MESEKKEIAIPDIKDLQVSANELLARANALQVTDNESCMVAGEVLLEITKRLKSVDDRMDEPVSAANKVHKFLTGLKAIARKPFLEIQLSTDNKIKEFRAKIARERAEDEARQRRQAEAKAEAERIAKAEKEMDRGDLKAAEKTLETPLQFAPPRVAIPEPPKMAGISYKTIFKYRIVNENLIPIEHMMPNPESIQSLVDSMGLKAMPLIPGIEVWPEEVSIKRTGRAA